MHKVHFLRGGDPLGYRSQDRATQLQSADLHVQSVGMRRRDLGRRDLPVQHLTDDGEVEAQVTQ
ncbi:hypothetical protein Aph01nite_64540 [Acrocarpospora phusangensis]|uniref:Uncharacterized protein n=1 Tax=Acrocarpospora phusangensis TaxID=1070424 RepID=A0A919UNQ6_9ACTN|nr:hypothetical protein Aph01nite_64540 [Acrocarpospora phusangensis]